MMDAATRRYSIEDLPGLLGKIVRKSELSGIYDTCMILQKSRLLDDHDIEGVLQFYGDGDSPEYQAFFMQSEPSTPIYFDSAELLEGVVYDE